MDRNTANEPSKSSAITTSSPGQFMVVCSRFRDAYVKHHEPDTRQVELAGHGPTVHHARHSPHRYRGVGHGRLRCARHRLRGRTWRSCHPDTPSPMRQREIDEFFGGSNEVSVVTLLFRGDALTPDGLSQMNALINEIVSDPSVGQLLAPVDPIIAPVHLIGAALQADNFESVTQSEIDSARNIPEIQGPLAAMTGTDADGTPVAIVNIRLSDTGDERIQDAERRINELAAGDDGPLSVSSLSPVIVEDEYREATESGHGAADRTGAAADRGAAPALHSHPLGYAANADGAYLFNSLGCRSGGLARAEWVEPDRTSEFAHCNGACHHYKPHGGLCYPGSLALPRADELPASLLWMRCGRGLRNVTIPLDAGRSHHDSQPAGNLVLADRCDRRLRHRRRAGCGNEPDSDADADPGRSDDH